MTAKTPRKAVLKEADPDHAAYDFEVIAATPSYTLKGSPPGVAKRYTDVLTIECDTRCIYPPALQGRRTSLLLKADRGGIDRPLAAEGHVSRDVGWLTMQGTPRRHLSMYRGWVPHDVAWGIMANLASGALKFVELEGDPLIKGVGGAMITSMVLHRHRRHRE
jgi:hypothetical protein